MKKIRHSDKTIKWHEVIQIAAHYYNTFPSASNAHSPFTSAENTAIHYGTNSIPETLQHQSMNNTSFGRLTQLKSRKTDQ